MSVCRTVIDLILFHYFKIRIGKTNKLCMRMLFHIHGDHVRPQIVVQKKRSICVRTKKIINSTISVVIYCIEFINDDNTIKFSNQFKCYCDAIK